MKKTAMRSIAADVLLITLGGALYALGFDLFLRPNDINGGGLSGLALIVSELTGLKAIGAFVLACNVPLFVLGWRHVGREFFLRSLLGMLTSSLLIDGFALLPGIYADPLLAGLYGGALVGVGLGLVFRRGASTGGTDIVARLVKRKLRRAPIGKILLMFDCFVVILTGVVFRDVNKALYSAVALFVMSVVMDTVIYGRSDSGVALIISERHREISDAIDRKLERGATLLPAQGAYTNAPKTVVLCAVKASQVGQLQALVTEIDPDAFMMIQKAHQVLGEGFGRYSADGL